MLLLLQPIQAYALSTNLLGLELADWRVAAAASAVECGSGRFRRCGWAAGSVVEIQSSFSSSAPAFLHTSRAPPPPRLLTEITELRRRRELRVGRSGAHRRR